MEVERVEEVELRYRPQLGRKLGVDTGVEEAQCTATAAAVTAIADTVLAVVSHLHRRICRGWLWEWRLVHESERIDLCVEQDELWEQVDETPDGEAAVFACCQRQRTQ